MRDLEILGLVLLLNECIPHNVQHRVIVVETWPQKTLVPHSWRFHWRLNNNEKTQGFQKEDVWVSIHRNSVVTWRQRVL